MGGFWGLSRAALVYVERVRCMTSSHSAKGWCHNSVSASCFLASGVHRGFARDALDSIVDVLYVSIELELKEHLQLFSSLGSYRRVNRF